MENNFSHFSPFSLTRSPPEQNTFHKNICCGKIFYIKCKASHGLHPSIKRLTKLTANLFQDYVGLSWFVHREISLKGSENTHILVIFENEKALNDNSYAIELQVTCDSCLRHQWVISWTGLACLQFPYLRRSLFLTICLCLEA